MLFFWQKKRKNDQDRGKEAETDVPARIPFEKGNYEKPDGYGTLSLEDMRFYYRIERKSTEGVPEGFTQEKDIADKLRLYRSPKDRPVLRIRMNLPIFDSGDREWDSYRDLYVSRESDGLCGILVAGGYKVASVHILEDLHCADAHTEETLTTAGIL